MRNFITYIVFTFTLLMSSSSIAGTTVYIPLGSGNMVIAVDADNDKIIAQYPDVINAHGLVATSDGEYLIAGSVAQHKPKTNDPYAPTSNLYLVHPEHGHMMSAIPVVGSSHHQAITPDDKYVLSTHSGTGGVSVMNMMSYKIERQIKTGTIPNYILISSDGKYAYVSNTVSATISEIDLSTWKVTRQLESGMQPEHLAFSKEQDEIYVANTGPGTVSVVNRKSGKISKTYMIGGAIHGLDISDDGKRLFASSKKGNKVVVIELANGKKHEIPLSPSPYHLNSIKGVGKVYVSSRSKPLIWVIDQKTLKLINTIKLPAGEGHQMAIVHRN
ncbi:MAG: beta-propeller fold lactonase family protein [Gammaproteobacteria bacterium]|nr:beta-propeller fold lactonase family protein [Gammaproteobacteria bacterium]